MNTLCKTLSIFKFWFSGILFTQFLPNFLNASPEFQLSWPTPNPSFARGLGYSTFLQKTGPEKPITSGAFGCVRNGGYKFHEGLDLFPVKKDKSGRAEDSVFAAMSGIVSHINSNLCTQCLWKIYCIRTYTPQTRHLHFICTFSINQP